MITDTAERILEYIRQKGQVSPIELVNYLGFSKQAVFKQLSKLTKEDQIYKIGKSPVVYYLLKTNTLKKDIIEVSPEAKEIIENNYLIITPVGEIKEGLDGFAYWCERNKLPITKTSEEYVMTWQKYDSYKKDGLIDGTDKIKSSFGDKVGLDKVFYLDFYALERFGKTKLGQILLYAKNSQDKKLIKRISDSSRDTILEMIGRYDIDAVGFIPPTLKRQIQLMKELKNSLALPLPDIEIVKISNEVIVPQKTLNKIEDRTENARRSIIVRADNRKFKNILLIDDAVGSGATLNETALKIKRLGLCSGQIIGLAITGSFKGFDVISEV